MEALWGAVKGVGKWCYKHRAGLLGAAAVGTGAYLAYRILQEHAAQRREELPALEIRRRRRSGALLRAEQDFALMVLNFLPNLQTKLVEKIDVSKLVRELKQLKAAGPDADKEQVQRLWRELLVSTFTLVMSSCFMFCTVVTLLKVQVHLLARASRTSSSGGGAESEGEPVNGATTSHQRLTLYHRLMASTYKPLMTTGLDAAVAVVRKAVERSLEGWSVETKPQVEFEELRALVKQMQLQIHQCAGELGNGGSTATNGERSHNGPEAERATSSFAQHVLAACRDAQPSTPGGASESKGDDAASSSAAGGDAGEDIQAIEWDVIESHLFNAAFDEALDKVLERVLMHLRLTAFGPNNAQAKPPALATLLPQLRPMPMRLCSTEKENLFLQEASSVEPLRVLCEALYDADVAR